MIKLVGAVHIKEVVSDYPWADESWDMGGHKIATDEICDLAHLMVAPQNMETPVTYEGDKVGEAIEEILAEEGIEGFWCEDGVVNRPDMYQYEALSLTKDADGDFNIVESESHTKDAVKNATVTGFSEALKTFKTKTAELSHTNNAVVVVLTAYRFIRKELKYSRESDLVSAQYIKDERGEFEFTLREHQMGSDFKKLTDWDALFEEFKYMTLKTPTASEIKLQAALIVAGIEFQVEGSCFTLSGRYSYINIRASEESYLLEYESSNSAVRLSSTQPEAVAQIVGLLVAGDIG